MYRAPTEDSDSERDALPGQSYSAIWFAYFSNFMVPFHRKCIRSLLPG